MPCLDLRAARRVQQPFAFDLAQCIKQNARRDGANGQCADLGEQEDFQYPLVLELRDFGDVLSVRPVACHFLKRVRCNCRSLGPLHLLGFALLAGIDTCCQQLACIVTSFACIGEANIRVRTQRETLVLAAEPVLEPPQLATSRGDFQI